MSEAALAGSFCGLYCQGEDIVRSDPSTQHVAAALSAMECIVVQGLFLDETAKYDTHPREIMDEIARSSRPRSAA